MTLRDKLKFWLALNNYIEMIVHDTSLLSLSNAMENSLDYLKALGGTEITPKVYFDSVTANGGCEQRNLPVEYTQLEYIESDGTQYIDTGIKGNQNTKVHIKARYYTTTTAGGSGRIFGSRDAAQVNAFAIGSASGTASTSSTISFFFGNQSYLVTDKNIILDEWLDVIFDKTIHNINGVDYGDPYNDETFETPQTLKIFGFDNSGTMGYGLQDCSKLQLWNNGILVRDFVPAKRNSDNVIGMYDTVSSTFFTNAGTGTFTAGPNAVPTPDNPVDIYCNNGVVKARHQSGLPLGYTLLDSIIFDSTQIIDTGFIPDNNSRIESKCYRTGDDCWFYGASPTNPRITLYHSKTGTSRWGNQSLSSVGFVADTEYTLVEDKNGLSINGVNNPWTSGTAGDFTCDRSLTIGNCNGSTGTRCFAGNLYYMRIYDNNVLVRNFVPCKNPSNVVGLYDKVNGVFYTDTGLVAGSMVSDPIEIYADGTMETINVCGKNLFDVLANALEQGGIASADGQNTMTSYNQRVRTNGYIPVKPNTVYTASVKDLQIYYLEYAQDTTYTDRHASGFSGNSVTFTTGVNTYFIRLQFRKSDNSNITPSEVANVQLERGSTATEYEPYFDGGRAVAENLFGLDTYKDSQEILSGAITRNIGIKVLDGTEEYSVQSINTYNIANIMGTITDKIDGNENHLLTTHFIAQDTTISVTQTEGILNSNTTGMVYFRVDVNKIPVTTSSTAAWKSWLAEQYANGTPVIIVYPLATSTTESVSPQSLTYIDNYMLTIEDTNISNPIVNATNSIHTIPTPDKPLDINCNNGVLKISKNLYNSATKIDGDILDDTGNEVQGVAGSVSDYIKIKPNTTYTLSLTRTQTSIYPRVCTYSVDKTFIDLKVKDTDTSAGDRAYTFITDSNAEYIRFCFKTDSTNIQLEQGSTATSYMPYGIYADGTVETIWSHGKNLFDENDVILGYFYEDNGTYTSNANTFTSGKIPMNAGTTVTFSRSLSVNNVYLRIHAFNSNNEWIGLVAKSASTSSLSITGITPANTSYIRVCGAKRIDSIEIDHECQVELGLTATAYVPYYNGGTATMEMLLKVGDYQDVQSIIDGVVTRNVGVKVLDGTENWSKSGSAALYYRFLIPNATSNWGVRQGKLCYCTHVQGIASTPSGYNQCGFSSDFVFHIGQGENKTVTQFKSWLASQYDAGTPVIVVYPLATLTTESVVEQSIQVAEGNNIAEITQASLDNLELEAKYNNVP